MGIGDRTEDPAAGSPRAPLTFAVFDREIVGVWLPAPSAAKALLRVLAGIEPPNAGQVRLRDGCRVALARPPDLPDVLETSADLVLLDATSDDLTLDAWVRLATERERGIAAVVATTSPTHAYRCDRVVLAAWDPSALLSALESLASGLHDATRDLLRDATRPRRAAVLAMELQRGTRAARDLIAHARAIVRSADERLRLSELSATAAGAMLDERILEKLIAEAEAL